MKKILVTGGTVFVSKYIAQYYVKKGYQVYVLNRNTKKQPEGTILIQADRHDLGDCLKHHHFDVVIDTAYTASDVNLLLDGLENFEDYVLISSSAVYPEHGVMPFSENEPVSINKYWGKYGTDKIEAENALTARKPDAYILRPPYLYGPFNNVYREAFVFDCALQDRCFYLPKDGEMKLQFLHVEDLCKFIDVLLEKRPVQHVFNVGNSEMVSVRRWVELCYRVAGKPLQCKEVYDDIDQRKYFSFYAYEYCLDVSRQHELKAEERDLYEGLKEAFRWYIDNSEQVNKKPLLEFIDEQFEEVNYEN